MKFSAVVTLAVTTSLAAAFVQPSSRTVHSARSVLSEPSIVPEITSAPPASIDIEVDVQEVVASSKELKETVDPNAQILPGRYDGMEKSIAMPFLARPPALDGSHAGDYGFDPLGFSESYDLYTMQEAELRHARLAMLAVVGWPLSELVGPDFMLQDGRAPSVLNGVNFLSGLMIVSALAAFGAFEYATSLRQVSNTAIGQKHTKDMEKVWKWGVAGDYNFDPLNLYNLLGDDAAGRKGLRTLEISHGRMAMLGISYFAWYENLSGKPIVEDNLLFHPNPIAPLAALSYLVWSQFYQISDLGVYPIKIEYSKDGEERLRGVKRSLGFGDSE